MAKKKFDTTDFCTYSLEFIHVGYAYCSANKLDVVNDSRVASRLIVCKKQLETKIYSETTVWK
jgi:hypothetical protein